MGGESEVAPSPFRPTRSWNGIVMLRLRWISAAHAFSFSSFVLDMFNGCDIGLDMSRASSHALKRPPVQVPSEPAGAPDPAKDFPGACGRHRTGPATRPGRPIERERPLRGGGAGRLRRRLAKSGRAAAVQDDGRDRYLAQGHNPQRFARYRLRSLDQSVSGLRARLRLLLRAADPRLSRPVAGARFRIQAVRQAGCAGAAGEGACRPPATSRK